MSLEGVDFSYDKDRISATQLYAAGRRFACRYLSYNSAKNLTKSEADRLKAAGLDIVSNWENTAGDMLLGRAVGLQHAAEAARQHAACGGPSTAPIFFSADRDFSSADLEKCWVYVQACIEVLGIERVGTYGGYRSVKFFADRGIKWLWGTYAWSAGQVDSRTHFYQYRNSQTLAGGAVDFNRTMKDQYGSWGSHGGSTGEIIGLRKGDTGQRVQALQGLLRRAGYTPGTTGVYDTTTSSAVLAMRKSQGSSATDGDNLTGAAYEQLWAALVKKLSA